MREINCLEINCLAYFKVRKSNIYKGSIGKYIQNLPQLWSNFRPNKLHRILKSRDSHTYDYPDRQVNMTTYGTTTATTTWEW